MNRLPAQKNKPNSNPVLSAVEWANFFKGQNRLPKNPATPFCVLQPVSYTLHSQIMAKRTMRVSWPDYQGLYRFGTFIIMGLGG